MSNLSTYLGVTNTENPPLYELAELHQQYVKGLEVLAQTTGSNNENLIVKRPWIDEPAGSIPFDEQNGVLLPQPPGAAAIATVLEYQVPEGFDGVIKFVNNNLNFGGFVEYSGDIIWRLLIDDRPFKNFEAVLGQKGSVAQSRPISPIRLYSKQKVKWVVEHPANAALAGQTICGFAGYIYPSKGVS